MGKTVYLVTGAAGFLASTVCRQLVREGKEVRGLIHRSAANLPAEVKLYKGDLCDKSSMEEFFKVDEGDETICLHVASVVSVSPEFDQRVYDSNIHGTDNIIDLCLQHPECKMLVYCSSTTAIPELPKGQKIKEVKDFKPELLKDCYSQTKAEASKRVLAAVNERGLKACIVHPSGIMGPEDYAISETTGSLIRIVKGELPAGIDGSFNLSDVRDLANGVILAGEKGSVGECYILANEEITFREFCKIVSDESGCKPIKNFLPIKLAYGFGWLSEKIAALTGKKALMTTFSVYNLARNNDFDYSKAQKELGYTTRSSRETLVDEMAWLKKEKMI